MDVAHSVLGGLLIATGGALMGKILSNKTVIARIDSLEKKLDEKLGNRVRVPECDLKHASMERLVSEKFEFITIQITSLIAKIDKFNNAQ